MAMQLTKPVLLLSLAMLLAPAVRSADTYISAESAISFSNYLDSATETVTSIVFSRDGILAFALVLANDRTASRVLVLGLSALPTVTVTSKNLSSVVADSLALVSSDNRYVLTSDLRTIRISQLLDAAAASAEVTASMYSSVQAEGISYVGTTHMNSRVLVVTKAGKGYLLRVDKAESRDLGYIGSTGKVLASRYESAVYGLSNEAISAGVYSSGTVVAKTFSLESNSTATLYMAISPLNNYLLVSSQSTQLLYTIDSPGELTLLGQSSKGLTGPPTFLADSTFVGVDADSGKFVATRIGSDGMLQNIAVSKSKCSAAVDGGGVIAPLYSGFYAFADNSSVTIYRINGSSSDSRLLEWNIVILIVGGIVTFLMLSFVAYAICFRRRGTSQPAPQMAANAQPQPRAEDASLPTENLTTDQDLVAHSGFTRMALTCPLSRQLLLDPVVARDGYTYEREAIVNWMESNVNSPTTKERLAGRELVPNLALSKLLVTLRAQRHPHGS